MTLRFSALRFVSAAAAVLISCSTGASGGAPVPSRLMALSSGTDLEVVKVGYQIDSSRNDAGRSHLRAYLTGVDRSFHSLKVSLEVSNPEDSGP